MTAAFHCENCGSINRALFVESVPTWYAVEMSDDGVITGLSYTRNYADDGHDQHFACPTCVGTVSMADGSAIVIEDWR